MQALVGQISSYRVIKGITEKQIGQLIEYTNKDKQVQKFTSDLKRFKDRETLDKWYSKRKGDIYTLVDEKDYLFGILWFTKEKFKSHKPNKYYSAIKYPYTFGIRLYSKARGKGLSQSFMEICFKDFGKKGIWMTVSEDNIPGLKLYRNFGFKQIPDENPHGKIVMVLN